MEYTQEKGCCEACVNAGYSHPFLKCSCHDDSTPQPNNTAERIRLAPVLRSTPQSVGWENAFIARFGYLEQKGRIVTGEVLLFIRTQIAAAEERGYEKAEEKYYQPAKTVSLTKEYKKGYQRGAEDMKQRAIMEIEVYFKNLRVVPFPELTKQSLVDTLTALPITPTTTEK